MKAFKRIVGSVGCIATVSVALACGEDIGASIEAPGEAAEGAVETAEVASGDPGEAAEATTGEPDEGEYISCYFERPDPDWTIELGDGIWGLQGYMHGTRIRLGNFSPGVRAPPTVVAGAGGGVLFLAVLLSAVCVSNGRKERAQKGRVS